MTCLQEDLELHVELQNSTDTCNWGIHETRYFWNMTVHDVHVALRAVLRDRAPRYQFVIFFFFSLLQQVSLCEISHASP